MKTGGVLERTLNRFDFYETFLIMLGSNYPKEKRLTENERKVLIEFMKLKEEKFKYNRFGKIAKDKVVNALNINKPNLERYIQDLRKKGYIQKDTDNISALNPMLNKLLEINELELKFKFKIND